MIFASGEAASWICLGLGDRLYRLLHVHLSVSCLLLLFGFRFVVWILISFSDRLVVAGCIEAIPVKCPQKHLLIFGQ